MTYYSSPRAAAVRDGSAAEGGVASVAMETARWFAVFTQPNQEARAQRELANQSFHTFLPRRQRTIRHARRSKTVMAPLFPRYLFVRFDPSRDRWRCIDGTYGVSHIVRFGETPAPVPRGVVEAIIETSDTGGVIRIEDFMQPGQTVCLAAGPFAEHLGKLHRLDGPQSVQILLEIMGRCVTVKAQRNNLLPA